MASGGRRASAEGPGAQDRDRECRVSMYALPPTGEVSLEEFESSGMDRLRVLRGLEAARARGRKGDDLASHLQSLLDKHLKGGGGRAEGARRDQVSHHVLRLAFCRSEDQRRWLLDQETALFRHRFGREPAAEQVRFMAEAGLPYAPIDNEEFAALQPLLGLVLQSQPGGAEAAARVLSGGKAGRGVNTGFFRVPFEEVPELVGRRRVLVRAGSAYVPKEDLASLVCGHFRSRLSRELVVAARHWAGKVAPLEADRLVPIVDGLATKSLAEDYTQRHTSADGVSLADVDALSERFFPLCMRTLYKALMSDHHLRHGGRLQLGLFLKGIGLGLEDALVFWKKEFSKKVGPEQFEKQYAYSIKHNYGREGQRKDYTPYSCAKVISATPGAGEFHGCPFRTFGADGLRSALQGEMKLEKPLVDAVIDKAAGNHFQLACGMVFEGAFGCACDEGIQHPNQYFEAGRAILEPKVDTPEKAAGPGDERMAAAEA